MQFYIIHKDPKVSAKNLPDYALKNVNVREGWQILSDIGHNFGFTWDGQNKLYSASHALTMEFYSSPEKFKYFVSHYRACCEEYYNRFGKMRKEMELFADLDASGIIEDIITKLPNSREESVVQYLLNRKGNKLSDTEKQNLVDNFK